MEVEYEFESERVVLRTRVTKQKHTMLFTTVQQVSLSRCASELCRLHT